MSVLNRSETKKMILRFAADLRPGWSCTRVSAQALDQIEARVQNIVRQAVKAHPTRGRTFTEVQ